MSERERDEKGRCYLTADELLSRPEGVPSVRDVLEGRGSREDELELHLAKSDFGLAVERLRHFFTRSLGRFKDFAYRRLVEEKEAQQGRGPATAEKVKARAERRNAEIVDLALQKAHESSTLAGNGELLASQIVDRWWREEWGRPLAARRVYNILSEGGVLKKIKKI